MQKKREEGGGRNRAVKQAAVAAPWLAVEGKLEKLRCGAKIDCSIVERGEKNRPEGTRAERRWEIGRLDISGEEKERELAGDLFLPFFVVGVFGSEIRAATGRTGRRAARGTRQDFLHKCFFEEEPAWPAWVGYIS